MADFNIKSKRDEEIEALAMNLRRNKLASSDSEARRMAEEMLSTSKKVQDDFVEREKRIYGGEKKTPQDEGKEETSEEPSEEEPDQGEGEEISVDEGDDEEPGDVGPGDEPGEPLQAEEGDDEGGDDDDKPEPGADDEGAEDEDKDSDGDLGIDASEEGSGEGSGEEDFSVKEIDNNEQLKKSEDDRKKEIEKMPESRIDLSNVFNA